MLLLDHWETEDVEKKYIFEALELLSARENFLLNEESVNVKNYLLKEFA